MNPNDAPEPALPSRRDFLGSACAASALIALGIPFAACSSSKPAAGGAGAAASGISVSGTTLTLDLTKADTAALAAPGGFLLLEDHKVVVINAGGTIRAFTSVCPHAGCDVDRREGDQLVCPCHGSRFGTDGKVMRGPARTGLQEYSTSRADQIVRITRS